MDDYTKIMGLLNANKNKTFVQRILNPDAYPVLMHDNGIATHRMAYAEANGKNYVFPTVLWDGKQLQDFGDSAFDKAMATGNVIEMPSAQEADWFTRNYKAAWGGRKDYMQEWERNRFNQSPF